MDDTKVEGKGLSRRELLKRSAVAGGVVWAAPVVQSSAAWAQAGCPAANCNPDCDRCCTDEFRIYAKFAPGDANPTDQQCLAPSGPQCPDVLTLQKVSLNDLVCAGFIRITDDVRSQDSTASFTILQPDKLRLIRTSIKVTSNCIITRCEDGFKHTTFQAPSTNPLCDQEHLTDSLTTADYRGGPEFPGGPRPLFSFFTGANGATPCSTTPTVSDKVGGVPQPGARDGTQCCAQITKVTYDTTALFNTTRDNNNETLNYIEVLFCFKGGSPIPACPKGPAAP